VIDKVHPSTYHDGTHGGVKYSHILSLTSASDDRGGYLMWDELNNIQGVLLSDGGRRSRKYIGVLILFTTATRVYLHVTANSSCAVNIHTRARTHTHKVHLHT
jgi:hypothetical protein